MRIAIVKLSSLGDIIHAMYVLQLIKKNNKSISIDWIVEEKFKQLLECNPYINEIYTVNINRAKKDKSIAALIRDFKKLNQLSPYDIVFDMQGLIKSALITKIIPSARKIGFDRSSVRESLASMFYDEHCKVSYQKNIVERNIEIINFVFNFSFSKSDITNKEPFIFSNIECLFNQISTNKKNILIIPGASFSAKCYPSKKYSKLINQMNANFIVTWGNDHEKKLANSIKSMSPKIEIMDKLSINELIALIKKVDLVIGSDTGPIHLAWALNIPSIALYGPTPAYRNSFKTLINKYIESDSKVNPYKIDKKDFSIKNIRVSDIVKMAEYLLKH